MRSMVEGRAVRGTRPASPLPLAGGERAHPFFMFSSPLIPPGLRLS